MAEQTETSGRVDYSGLSAAHQKVEVDQPHHHQQAGHVEGATSAPTAAWAAVGTMIIGFTLCTLGFVFGNNLILWISGGVIGAVGVVIALSTDIMSNVE